MTKFFDREPPWFESVKDLKPGGKRRVADGKLASFNGRAYHLYDFREKTSEVYEPQLTLEQRIAYLRARNDAGQEAAKKTTLPYPMVKHPRDWPNKARVWLYQAGWTDDDIAATRAYWAPRMERVVLPLQMLDGSQRWIARAVDGESPKYLFPQGMSRGGGAVRRPLGLPADVAIVTEDYLSAYRVTNALDVDGIAALGTSLDRDALVKIASTYEEVGVWLDPDKWGQAGGTQIRQSLQRLGVDARIMHSERDPKYLSDTQIAEVWEKTWRT